MGGGDHETYQVLKKCCLYQRNIRAGFKAQVITLQIMGFEEISKKENRRHKSTVLNNGRSGESTGFAGINRL